MWALSRSAADSGQRVTTRLVLLRKVKPDISTCNRAVFDAAGSDVSFIVSGGEVSPAGL